MIADAKCWPGPFEEIRLGTKTFDVRAHDSGLLTDARAGDIIRFREWDDHIHAYTGRQIEAQITYQLRTYECPSEWHLPGGLIVSSFRILRNETREPPRKP